VLILLHAAIAITFKALFFDFYLTDEIGPKDPIPGGDEGGEIVKRWLTGMMY
jgi:hypothetical protein